MSAALDLAAGKYALFVWPAYVLTVIVIAGLVADTLARARRWRRAAQAGDGDKRP
jgi:heme exporter protein D